MTPVQYVPLICAVVSAACAVYVTVRQARWRETDDARAIAGRITALTTRMEKVETRQEGMPTKADLATLSGDIQLVKQLIERAERGIDRIENFMMGEARRS